MLLQEELLRGPNTYLGSYAINFFQSDSIMYPAQEVMELLMELHTHYLTIQIDNMLFVVWITYENGRKYQVLCLKSLLHLEGILETLLRTMKGKLHTVLPRDSKEMNGLPGH